MDKITELRQLFEQWSTTKHDANDFFRDGIIDEETWNSTSPKILYILKEVHETAKAGNAWSIAEMLSDAAQAPVWNNDLSATWANVIRWTFGLTEPIYTYHPKLHDFGSLRSGLRRCAVLNLKKTRGGADADMEQVGKAAADNREWIKREIAIIDPDIIICCGTYDIVKWRVFDPNIPDHILKSGNICFTGKCPVKEYLFVSHYHPNNRSMRSPDLYNCLATSVLCARNEGLISREVFKDVPSNMPFL